MSAFRAALPFGLVMLAMALPASAAGKADELAACMWTKKPTTTAAFADTNDRMQGFSLFLKAAADCGGMPKNINLSSLRKKVVATRPAVIGPDQAGEAAAFFCPTGADGTTPDCKPAGE